MTLNGYALIANIILHNPNKSTIRRPLWTAWNALEEYDLMYHLATNSYKTEFDGLGFRRTLNGKKHRVDISIAPSKGN